MTGLQGQVALVTGASRGLGRAIAKRLAADGARIIAHYGSSGSEAETLAAEIRAGGGSVELVQADLASADGPHRLAADVKALLGGVRIDILINNAGVASFADLQQQTVEDFDRQFAVNVRAPFFLTQQLADVLTDGARVVFTSSIVARTYFAGVPAYSATKGAVDTLVRNFAAILAPRGIRVNAVAPGAIATDMASFLGSEEGKAAVLGIQALQRIGQPDDIADAVAFLAGPDSRWVTGEVVQVSGGSKL